MNEKEIKEIIDQIYSGYYAPNKNLPEYVFLFNFTNLINEVESSFGLISSFKKNSIKRMVSESFRTNINVFSGAKTFDEVKTLSNFLWDGEKKRAKDEFIKKAIEINDVYNGKTEGRWLRTEMDAAYKQGMAAKEWFAFEDEKEIFPYLQYKTVGDEKVRDEHAAWNDLVYPVDHSFWNTHYPPNDWGCRCYVIQLREAKVSSDKKATPNESKLWANNPAKDMFIFDQKQHPYFKNVPKEVKRNNFGFGYE